MDRFGTAQAEYSPAINPGFTETDPTRDGPLRKWREQREFLQGSLYQALTLAYCEPRQQDAEEILRSVLHDLCGELVDYLCTGHFRVYQYGFNSSSCTRNCSRQEEDKLRSLICRHIGCNTDELLAFNERIEKLETSPLPGALAQELTRLYRSLSLRFMLEEQLMRF